MERLQKTVGVIIPSPEDGKHMSSSLRVEWSKTGKALESEFT
jgi:hypothetical protein